MLAFNYESCKDYYMRTKGMFKLRDNNRLGWYAGQYLVYHHMLHLLAITLYSGKNRAKMWLST